ncbi:MAG: FecR family protein, partial [Acidobacteriota bacterium]|nr:FecR family protein [Acidobacteriota bacterium]
RRVLPLALAAVLLLALGLGLFAAYQQVWSGASRMARIEAVEGSLYRISATSSRPLAVGQEVAAGDEVRTAKASTAVLRMSDGSRVEMNERATLAFEPGRSGNTIHLAGGRIIVHAAKQRPRHLYIMTDDCTVAVTGTIFAVNHGLKGSRVSVVEGEVRVRQAKSENILHPGQQVTTRASLTAVPVRQEIAWSRDAAQYDALLTQLTAAGKEIDSQVQRPGLRTSTRLLDRVPDGSTVYIALPNLAASLHETQRLLDQRLAESDVLRQWWSETLGTPENETRFHDMIEKVGDLGQNLGDEVAIAGGSQDQGAAGAAPVLLAEVANEPAFRATLAGQIAEINAHQGSEVLRIVGDPAALPPQDASGAHPILLWVGNGMFAASPSGAQLARVAATSAPGAVNPFVGGGFHARVAQAYADGAGWLFAADLAHLIANQRAGQRTAEQAAERLGILDLDNFVVDRRDIPGGSETRAALAFNQPRRGVAAWLAAPATMGSLSFFSPDANLLTAFVVKSPVSLVDDLLGQSPDFAAQLAKAEAEYGINLRDDLAAPLGGEFALGLDGPLVPKPSWKLVAEVYDPVRLEQTFERLVAAVNRELVKEGKPGLTLSPESLGGLTYYTLLSGDGKVSLHYLFTAGYFVAAPSRSLLEVAVQQRASGVNLASSGKLRDLLGQDGQVNASALFYQNLAPIAGSLGITPQRSGPASGPKALAGLLIGRGPSLVSAYAQDDRILFAGRSDAGPLGLNLGTLTGFGAVLGSMEQAHDNAMRQRAR